MGGYEPNFNKCQFVNTDGLITLINPTPSALFNFSGADFSLTEPSEPWGYSKYPRNTVRKR